MAKLKVALSCEGDSVSAHFGRCQKYVLASIEDGILKEKQEVLNPGHEPGFLPLFLKQQGVNVMIAGGAGPRAVEILKQNGIDCILGVSGNVNQVLDLFMQGKLEAGESSCSHE